MYAGCISSSPPVHDYGGGCGEVDRSGAGDHDNDVESAGGSSSCSSGSSNSSRVDSGHSYGGACGAYYTPSPSQECSGAYSAPWQGGCGGTPVPPPSSGGCNGGTPVPPPSSGGTGTGTGSGGGVVTAA